jgi:putative tryptophan/tyrosine transport system substrate-binding protein
MRTRRELITLLGGAAAAWPLAARAQQRVTSPRRIGVLLVGLSSESKEAKQFRLGLAGYSEGRDVVIEWRSANGDYDRVPALVADLVQKKVEVKLPFAVSTVRPRRLFIRARVPGLPAWRAAAAYAEPR